MALKTPQIQDLRFNLSCALDDETNWLSYIRQALDQLRGLDDYVQSLEAHSLQLMQQIEQHKGQRK